MSSYCTSTDIIRFLPTNHGISSFTAIVSGASALVDSDLSSRYWPFPDVTATPATPIVIQQLASLYGAWLSYAQIGATGRMDGPSPGDRFLDQARTLAKDLMIEPIKGKVPPVVVTSETMTGLGSSPLDADQYKFACAPRDVIPESVVIATYQNGVDFYVSYSAINRGWILTRMTGSITSSKTVSYEYTFIRHHEVDLPVGVGSGKIIRA